MNFLHTISLCFQWILLIPGRRAAVAKFRRYNGSNYLLMWVCFGSLYCRLFPWLKEFLMSAVNLHLVQEVLWLVIKFVLIVQGVHFSSCIYLYEQHTCLLKSSFCLSALLKSSAIYYLSDVFVTCCFQILCLYAKWCGQPISYITKFSIYFNFLIIICILMSLCLINNICIPVLCYLSNDKTKLLFCTTGILLRKLMVKTVYFSFLI